MRKEITDTFGICDADDDDEDEELVSNDCFSDAAIADAPPVDPCSSSSRGGGEA
jgi:hypothetical protein